MGCGALIASSYPATSGAMMTFPRLKLGRTAFLLALLAMPVAGYAQAPATPKTVAPAAKAATPEEKTAPPAQAPGQAPTDPAAKASGLAPGGAPAPGGDEPAEAADRSIERMKSRINEFEARTDVAPDIRDRHCVGPLKGSPTGVRTHRR